MALAYTAPTWENGGGVGISASQLQALSDCMEGLVQGSDKAITNIAISGQTITLTFADGSQESGTASGLKGISSIAKTGTSGNVDTYTITYTDGSTSTFTVTNGADGSFYIVTAGIKSTDDPYGNIEYYIGGDFYKNGVLYNQSAFYKVTLVDETEYPPSPYLIDDSSGTFTNGHYSTGSIGGIPSGATITTQIFTDSTMATLLGEVKVLIGLRGSEGEQGPQGPAGDDGVSPEVTITTITGGHRVKITDATHPQGQDFDVMDGANTVVPNPQGTSVGDLTSIGINGDKYDIQGGGGGSSTFAGLSDVQFTNLQDGQIPIYDAASQKWVNKYVNSWLVPWSIATDEQIIQMIQGYYNGDITLQEIKSVWSVGDVRNVDISAIAASGGSGATAWSVSESHRAQTVKVQIIDFDHDTLATPINGITKALITVDIKDMLVNASCPVNDYSQNAERGYMSNTTSNVGGWGSSARRAWCNNAFYNALPTYMKNLVKTVVKSTSAGSKSSTIVTTNDDVFLASSSEHYADNGQGIAGEGTLYKLFETQSNLIKLPDYTSVNSTYISGAYWERNPLITSDHHFCRVGVLTVDSADVTNEVNGIAPCWCM